MIENNILAISNVLFKNRNEWKGVTNQQKEQFFFVFNRFFSKKYLELSFLLNNKNIDKASSMDLWFEYMKDKPYPQWFWSKSKNQKVEQSISNKDFDILLKHLNLKSVELDFLLKHHKTELIEELDYLKKLT